MVITNKCLSLSKCSQYIYIQGCPAADANKMMEKGMTTKIESTKIGEKKWRAIITCKEVPAMNEVRII